MTRTYPDTFDNDDKALVDTITFKPGGVINDSPIGPIHLNRRARCTELIWLAQAFEASGLTPRDVTSIERYGEMAIIRLVPRVVKVNAS